MGAIQATAKRRHTIAVKNGKMTALPEWALSFAQWRATQGKNVPFARVMQEAQLRSPVPLDERDVRNVLKSEAYGKYLGWCVNDVEAAARYKFNRMMMKAVELHDDALGWARDEHDYKATPSLTAPLFDRLVPKRDSVMPQTNIQINLTGKQLEALNTEVIAMESQALLPEPDEST